MASVYSLRSLICRDGPDTVFSNPTYELRAASVDPLSPARREGGAPEVYEVVTEPISKGTHDLEAQGQQTLAYAVHTYPDNAPSPDIPNPVVFGKPNSPTTAENSFGHASCDGIHTNALKLKPQIPSKPTQANGAVLQLDSGPKRSYFGCHKKFDDVVLHSHSLKEH